ncbi:MAG: methyltransferase domain-containing protein [Telmatospirillum sp.]|nr:methyltransferase domain-containing protein [Telmatospirillum sp.]
MSSPNLSLGRYYDRLTLYARLARWLGADAGYGAATVHRALRPAEPGQSPFEVVHGLIDAELGPADLRRLLDAGCGLGGTGLYFARQRGTHCDGIALSVHQVNAATDNARKAGLAARCRFQVASFDGPLLPQHYDAIVAIESMAHAPDLAASIANLAKSLAPGGRLVVVDDVAAPVVDPRDSALFKAGWQVPSFTTHEVWLAAFAQAGLRIVRDIDLTARVVQRPAWRRAALTGLNAAACALVPHADLRAVLASHRGGLALERLYARGQSAYRLFVAL